MELKFRLLPQTQFRSMVLIIPYGIEILYRSSWPDLPAVLIIPYGIEIGYFFCILQSYSCFNHTLWNWNSSFAGLLHSLCPVLIIPYGIEITRHSNSSATLRSFNHTLWNWNTRQAMYKRRLMCFNHTLWNWNHVASDRW